MSLNRLLWFIKRLPVIFQSVQPPCKSGTLRLHNTTPYKVGVVVHPLEVKDDHDFRLTTSGGRSENG